MDQQILQLRLQGKTIKQVCDDLKIKTSEYYKHAKALGLSGKAGGSDNLIALLSGNREDKSDYLRLFNKLNNKQQDPIIALDDIKELLSYNPGEHTITPNLHIGQRKLFLSELEFFTLYFQMKTHVKNPIVVYAGAAPSNHTYYLSQLFPTVKFILVDPAPFHLFVNRRGNSHRKQPNKNIIHLKTGSTKYNGLSHSMNNICQFVKSSNAKIFIIEDLFTEELAEQLKPLNALFICDIRTRDTSYDKPIECDVLWNMAQQFVWVNILKPPFYMLKFRQPFYDNQSVKEAGDCFQTMSQTELIEAKKLGIDFIGNFFNKKFQYFKGTMYIQCFPGQKSTETRLISSSLEIVEHDFTHYESSMYYYNSINRPFVIHKNTHANKDMGFDHCNDCAKEAYLWENYNKVMDDKTPVINHVRQLSYITKPLLKDNSAHGKLFHVDKEYLQHVYDNRYYNAAK